MNNMTKYSRWIKCDSLYAGSGRYGVFAIYHKDRGLLYIGFADNIKNATKTIPVRNLIYIYANDLYFKYKWTDDYQSLAKQLVRRLHPKLNKHYKEVK